MKKYLYSCILLLLSIFLLYSPANVNSGVIIQVLGGGGGGGSSTFHAYGSGSDFAAGTLNSSAFAVSSGDLIVACVGVQDEGSIQMDSLDDDSGNSYTLTTTYNGDGSNIKCGYVLSATEDNATLVVTAGFSDEVTADGKAIYAFSFTPAPGKSFSIDLNNLGKASNFEATPFETNQGNTTGTDEVCIAAIQYENANNLSNFEIPGGTAADASFNDEEGRRMEAWYSIKSATVTNIDAEVDASASDGYSMDMLCFKAE